MGYKFKKIILLFSIFYFLFSAGAVLAQVKLPQIFNLNFINSGEPIENVVLTLDFPVNLTPIHLSPNAVWNADAGKLLISVTRVEKDGEVKVAVEVDGPPGVYKITGKIDGEWPSIGEKFSSPLSVLEVVIPSPPEEPLAAETLGSFIKGLKSDPQVIAVVENVVVPATVTVAAAGAAAVATSAVSSNAAIAYNIIELARFAGFGFVRFRRRKPWGRVHNSATGKPIAGASVKIFDTQFNKLKGSEISDREGRFGFLVSPGSYYIYVSKRGFKVHQTGAIKVSGTETVLNIDIPLESEDRTAVQSVFIQALNFLKNILEKINPFVLILGTLASLIAAVIVPTTLNFGVLSLYIVIDALKIILAGISLKSFGRVTDKATGLPIALSVVRIFDAKRNWLLTTKATDDQGRFKFLVVPGQYYITCAKQGYHSFISEQTAVRRAAAIIWDITLIPER